MRIKKAMIFKLFGLKCLQFKMLVDNIRVMRYNITEEKMRVWRNWQTHKI